MKKFVLITAVAASSLLAGCTSTSTMRNIQDMHSHNDQIIVKYGEVVITQTPFATTRSYNGQKFAKCDQSDTKIDCKTLNFTIDGQPLISTKKTSPF